MGKERTPYAKRCGTILKTCRQRCGLSQEELAKLTDPIKPYHPGYIGALETGVRAMNPSAAKKLAKALSDTNKIGFVSPLFLLGEIESQNELEKLMPFFRQAFENQETQSGAVLYLLSLYGIKRVGVFRKKWTSGVVKPTGLEFVACDSPTDYINELSDYYIFLGSGERGENQPFIINGHQFELLKKEIGTYLSSRIAIYDELTRNSDLFSGTDRLAEKRAEQEVEIMLRKEKKS